MGTEACDVFVSYARADARHARAIYEILRSHGLSTFFDRDALAPGRPWVSALEQAIGSAKSVIVLIGPNGLGNTQQYERDLAFVRQSRDKAFPVVPVLLPGTRTDHRPLDFLNLLTWIDFSHVTQLSDAPEELQRLLAAARGLSPEGGLPQDAICPYRGLNAFREEDAAFFFGRGGMGEPGSPIAQLFRKVQDHAFVMVVGRSGSGKSSLVYAGLMPALRRERDRFWNMLSLRPGPEPLRSLAAAFNPARAEDEGAATYQAKIGDEAERLRSGDLELLAHMIRDELERAEGRPDRLLLYIDQWEELYALAPRDDKGRAARHAGDVNRFIDLLLTASKIARVSVVATVRADFYDPLIRHHEIRQLLQDHEILLGSMPRSELEHAILEPAQKVGLTFDPPGLVRQILDEVGEDEGMLPLLQFALEETWKNREGNRMTARSYLLSGGVGGAIRERADETFRALSDEDKKAVRLLFLRLVKPGEGQEDTRQRADMPSETSQKKIVQKFADPGTRLLVTGFDVVRGQSTVEVAHEALIRTWPLLRGWIDANRERLRARDAVLQAKAEWEKNGKRDDLLLPVGFQLERARSLMADPGDTPTEDIEDFVSLSWAREDATRQKEVKAQQRRVRNKNYTIAVMGVLALLAFGVSVLAWQARTEAQKQRKEALEQRAEALKQRVDADKQREEAQKQKEQANSLMTVLAKEFIAKLSQQQVDSDTREIFSALQVGAARGNTTAMYILGLLYSEGQGVPQDDAKAREWWGKATEKGDADAEAGLEWLPIEEVARSGRYVDALKLAEDSAIKKQEEETKREGKPGKQTAEALNEVAWRALFARDFQKALDTADRAHVLLPDSLRFETNRAHALTFIGRGKEATALYLAYKGKPFSDRDSRPWESVIASDFAKFRKAGLKHPTMADIEKKLGIAR